MVLEPILEEPEDEYVDLFNLSDGKGAPPRPAVWRSLSGPSRFHFQNDTAFEQWREHVIIPLYQKKSTEKHESTKKGG